LVFTGTNLGIGSSSPAYKLDITGAVRLSGTGYNATTSPSVILTNTTASTGRIFVLNSFNTGGFQIADDTGGLGATRLQIDSVGNATFNSSISVGGAIPSTSGAGLTFPATQSASSDANTLDDYEEGTWTPILTTSGSAPTITFSFKSGVYRKVGTMVYIQFGLYITGVSGGSGTLVIQGLPFTSISRLSYGEPSNSLQGGGWSNSSYAGQVYWFVGDAGTNAYFRYQNNSDTDISISAIQAGTYMSGILVYCSSN
jgi:hypothetical protein